MYISRVAVVLFTASALAELSEVWSDATSFGAMLARGEAIEKRQGYVPGQRSCGTGRTCEEACGAGSVQCPSNDRNIHCHYPATGTHCCTDGTGNACRAGYYCTTDGRSTYCCPDGIQNNECARLYSLTMSLYQTSVAAIPSASSRVPGLQPLLSTSTSRIHVTSTPSSIVIPTISALLPTPLIVPSTRVAAGTSTTTNAPQFAAGAAKVKGAGAGMAFVAGVAGILL